MAEKLVVGPINSGYKNNRTAFAIDNDSFPALINAYQWRGRLKRKRGTQFLGRLQRYIGTTDGAGNLIVTILPIPIATGIVSFTVGTDKFTDPGTTANPGVQNLLSNRVGATATLNRVTGLLTIFFSKLNADVIYFPTLPVMGLEDFFPNPTQFPGTIAFDTRYSYKINTDSPNNIYDVSFYKNPIADGVNMPGYTPKAVSTPVTWNGEDYQQFWTVNYQGAMWATNGIDIGPTTLAHIGMQFQKVTAASVVVGPTTIVTFTLGVNNLVVGDFVFANEFTASTAANAATLNFQTGYVTVAGVVVTVVFPKAAVATDTYSNGLLQFLTNRSDTSVDPIRWYDGDPTNGISPIPPIAPAAPTGLGWVNFSPPLSQFLYSIADTPPAQYYLVGARILVPFKDRLLAIGPVIQNSSGTKIYLQDTVIYSQNGTPYYTASFTGDPSLATTIFYQLLVPTNQTASAPAWWEDQTGFGGFLTAGIDQPITTMGKNNDVLIIGFSESQAKLVYSGNDVLPFSFYLINTELGSASTFSTIEMDTYVMNRGERSFTATSQTNAERFDLAIPDQVFEISLANNGNERVCSQRDFINEWNYWTYPSNLEDREDADAGGTITYKFPNETLLYNYRDDSFALIYEAYTHYGQFRRTTGNTWATIGQIYESWAEWNDPWDAGESTIGQPLIIAGNQQGFVLFKDKGTGEATSLVIQNIVANTVTSPDHTLNEGDYIIITGAQGTVSSQVNGKIFSVSTPTQNTFVLNPSITTSVYTGGGLITRMYVPFIQSKQFPVAWAMSKKTRIGNQQYLLTTTSTSEIQLLIYLSQNSESPYNYAQPIEPNALAVNNGLIYSTVLYTCPESTNLGLTPANTNLQMLIEPGSGSSQSSQIWHRINTSLIGDTIQVGFTMSDTQMRSLTNSPVTTIITGITLGNPTTITTANTLSANQIVKISGIVGTTNLNFNPITNNTYVILSTTTTQVVIDVDSTAFPAWVSGGIITPVSPVNQFAEIEIHGFNLECSASSMLA